MRYEGKRNWPPAWISQTGGQTLTGEIGILRQVVADTRLGQRCLLIMEHDSGNYIGTLLFDDSMFCVLITAVLKKHIGLSIDQIGDVDLSYS